MMAPIAGGRINLAIAVAEATQVAEARRAGASLARQIGMDETYGRATRDRGYGSRDSNVLKHGGRRRRFCWPCGNAGVSPG